MNSTNKNDTHPIVPFCGCGAVSSNFLLLSSLLSPMQCLASRQRIESFFSPFPRLLFASHTEHAENAKNASDECAVCSIIWVAEWEQHTQLSPARFAHMMGLWNWRIVHEIAHMCRLCGLWWEHARNRRESFMNYELLICVRVGFLHIRIRFDVWTVNAPAFSMYAPTYGQFIIYDNLSLCLFWFSSFRCCCWCAWRVCVCEGGGGRSAVGIANHHIVQLISLLPWIKCNFWTISFINSPQTNPMSVSI